MPRPPGNGLILTNWEHDWLVKTAGRTYTASLRLPAGSYSKKEQTALFNLSEKAVSKAEPGPSAYKVILRLTRVDLRVLQKLITPERDSIIAQIIPGYLDKINSASDDAERVRLNGHLESAQVRATSLTNMLNKIAERLSD